MRVALIASPFISVPPTRYGGTELFIANLAEGLARLDVKVDVYANGESRVKASLHSRYARQDWPLASETTGVTKEVDPRRLAYRLGVCRRCQGLRPPPGRSILASHSSR